MFNFISKLYQSIIDRDQQVKRYVTRNGMEHRVHSAVAGYDNFESQMDALGHSRTYRKIALKAEARQEQLPERFFFKNYATRDLVDVAALLPARQALDNVNLLLEVLFDALEQLFDVLPPPLKSKLIPDINLTARLLPTPTQTSA